MLIKDFQTYLTILIFLLNAYNSGIISHENLNKFLDEIYFQPYPEFSKQALYHRVPDFDQWQRPEGPIKIGLQIGHLLEGELPFELRNLETEGGARKGLLKEVEINKLIGYKVKKFLEDKGYQVEILSVVVPPLYYADAFVSLHTNFTHPEVSGFMISTPFKDYSGKAEILKEKIIKSYQETGMKLIPRVTERMLFYYVFNWSRFKHALHPQTPAVILEMGNMNNWKDLIFLIVNSDKVAEKIAQGIIDFIETRK